MLSELSSVLSKMDIIDSSNVVKYRSNEAIFSAIETLVVSSESIFRNLDRPKPAVTYNSNY